MTPHELRTQFQIARADLLAAIEGLTPAQLCEESLDGWSVKDHLMHLAAWDRVRAEEIERISAGFDSAWALTDPQEHDYNETMYAKHKNLSAEQALWELAESRKRLTAALESITERGLDSTHYRASGPAPRHEAEHTGWIRNWRQEKGY